MLYHSTTTADNKIMAGKLDITVTKFTVRATLFTVTATKSVRATQFTVTATKSVRATQFTLDQIALVNLDIMGTWCTDPRFGQ